MVDAEPDDEGPHRPFLDAIYADPTGELPRLVYADWLDERGENDAATFVRGEVALAKLEDEWDRVGACPSCGAKDGQEHTQTCGYFALKWENTELWEAANRACPVLPPIPPIRRPISP